jgi:hypothetical protein
MQDNILDINNFTFIPLGDGLGLSCPGSPCSKPPRDKALKRKGNRNPKKKVRVKKVTAYKFSKINLQRISRIKYRETTLGKCKKAYEVALKVLSYVAQFQPKNAFKSIPVLQSDYVKDYSKGTVTEVFKALMASGMLIRDEVKGCSFNYSDNHSFYYDIDHNLISSGDYQYCDFKRTTKDAKKLTEIERRKNGDDELREEYKTILHMDIEDHKVCPCCDVSYKLSMFAISRKHKITNPVCSECWYECEELARILTNEFFNNL